MSDADNQMGGQGGETGRDPGQETPDPPDPENGNEQEPRDAGQPDDGRSPE